MRILLTGAEGFLGWHLRCRIHATTDHEVVPVSRTGVMIMREANDAASLRARLAARIDDLDRVW